ncbi:MAG: hypothetical protein IJ136_01075 [Erysipelotrichaceae bacterium]|nr:hypothetical protein [Erysipelotrichaceae bacterium]
MTNTVISKQRYLVHSKVYSSTEVKKYRLSIPANVPVSTDMFFGSQGYNNYVQNGHGVEDVELLDDVTPEEAKEIAKAAARGYAGSGYVGDEHGVASGLDAILAQIDAEEGNDISEWQRSPFTISSMGRLDTPELRQQMADIMRESFSEKGNIVWYPIVSIESYKVAEGMKLFRDEDYEAVILESLPRWFRSVRLDPDNMLWTVDYHNNTDNPHLHYIFLEKRQTRTKGNFSLSDLNNLKEQFYASATRRARLLQDIENGINESRAINPELKALHEQMDQSNRRLREQTKAFLAKKMDQKIEQDIYKLFTKIDDVTLGRGKISMNSKNMAPFKKDVMKIVEEVLDHPANKDLYEETKKTWKDLDQQTKGEVSESADRYQVNEDLKLKTAIGNCILQLKKDFDEAYYKSHLDVGESNRLSVKELKLLRNKYLKSREYKFIQEKDNPRGFAISFKDSDLKMKFMSLMEESKLAKFFETGNVNKEEIFFKSNEQDERSRAYNDTLFRKYSRVLLNNLQDHPEQIGNVRQNMIDIGSIKEEGERQQEMIRYIALHGNQPDNEFFFRQKKRMFYKSYAGAFSEQARTSKGFSYDGIQSNSFLVLSGLNRLLQQRGRYDAAAERTQREAEHYWDNQQWIDQQKAKQKQIEEDYDVEISY